MKKTKDPDNLIGTGCKIQACPEIVGDKRRLCVVVKGGDRVCPDNKIILFQR